MIIPLILLAIIAVAIVAIVKQGQCYPEQFMFTHQDVLCMTHKDGSIFIVKKIEEGMFYYVLHRTTICLGVKSDFICTDIDSLLVHVSEDYVGWYVRYNNLDKAIATDEVGQCKLQ